MADAGKSGDREALERMQRRWDVLADFPPDEGLTARQAARLHREMGLELAKLFADDDRRPSLERELAYRLERLVDWTTSGRRG